MLKLFALALFGAYLLNSAEAHSGCIFLPPPRYGSVTCTDGSEELSRCRYSCNEDYQLSANSNSNRRCICRNDVCDWDGSEPVCEYRSPSQSSCPIPRLDKAAMSVVDVWPTAVILRVQVHPIDLVNQGWSVALMFKDSLPEGFQLQSGHATHVSTSEDRKILTFNSKQHNSDISHVQVYSFYLMISNLPENMSPERFSALAGFYHHIIPDASCIQVISPIRPLPTTTPGPTTTKATTTTQSTTHNHDLHTKTTGAPTPSSTTHNHHLHTKTASTTRRTTTTTRPTTTTTTTTRPTTTAAPGVVPNDCEVLDDASEPGYRLLNPGWREGNSWKFTGRFEKNSRNQQINDWVFKIEFPEIISGISIYAADADAPYEGGRVWIIRPKSWNAQFSGELKLNFIGAMQYKNGATNSGPATNVPRVLFCRNGYVPSTSLEGNAGGNSGGNTGGNTGGNSGTQGPSTTVSTTVSTTTTTVATRPAATASPQFMDNCQSTDESAFSTFPARSRQTNPNLSSRSRELSKILHMSVLFYEAQRSGRLPTNNPILWRGDSGLKDGCDVGIDLTGGFYDAGDNVKFGFPMAYTMTVLAWSMIEFKDAYVNSNDWNAALDLLKWGTDYLIKAHSSKYELYIQVADANRDHGSWLRPEDVDYIPKTYKIDANNPGSEVAAETSAAMSAASVVFRSINSQYADTLVMHAKELYEFADRYRGNYQDSVPEVTSFYRSWSGYNDELLWGAIWLYKSTNEQKYLNSVRNNYNNYGAGNSPHEFSWDNKFGGVQILMAEATGEEKYVNDVKRFYTSFDRISKTPGGLTWRSQWGSNRYAANFAFISIMAAKTLDLGRDEAKFVNYARSQINYILGANEGRRSFVVGHDQTSPKRPHHRASSCPTWTSAPPAPCNFNSLNANQPNPHILYGALVGGPYLTGEYIDDRRNYTTNEVALDYNAGFQGAVAGLLQFDLTGFN